MFDNPYRNDVDKEEKTLLCNEHIEAARDISRKSIVRLKNDNNALSLKKDLKKIAVVGSLAENAGEMLGTWSHTGNASDVVTVLSGIKSAVSSETEILYAEGCKITGDEDMDFEGAVKLANESDVIIAVVGENSDMSGEVQVV